MRGEFHAYDKPCLPEFKPDFVMTLRGSGSKFAGIQFNAPVSKTTSRDLTHLLHTSDELEPQLSCDLFDTDVSTLQQCVLTDVIGEGEIVHAYALYANGEDDRVFVLVFLEDGDDDNDGRYPQLYASSNLVKLHRFREDAGKIFKVGYRVIGHVVYKVRY